MRPSGSAQSEHIIVPGQGLVYRIDPLEDPRWPVFVAEHPDASPFHSRGWLRALKVTYGYEPVAFTTSVPTVPLANALVGCIVRSWVTGTRLVSLPFSDHCEPLISRPDEFGVLIASLAELRKTSGWKYIEIRSANPCLEFGDNFSQVNTSSLHRLDLRPDLDVLYRGLHKNCVRRKIHRAEREGLIYEVGRSEQMIDHLYGLLSMTRARHCLPPQPIEWFRNLVSSMGSNVCIRSASKDGRPIAGMLTLRQGKYMVYKYGASDTVFNHLGGVAMLFWETIKEAKRAGMEWLDFGRSDHDNPGLITFKRRWAAECFPLTTWQIPGLISSAHRNHLTMRCARALFSRLPPSVLTLAGRLLYRHVG